MIFNRPVFKYGMAAIKAMGVFIFFMAIAVSLAGAPERAEEVPNPLAASGKCVGDGAGVLGPEYIDLIHSVSVRLKEATGSELAVVTVRDLGGTTSEDFAERLFKRFGIGEKGKDNGILILLARDDRAVRIEVGYGLESVITDAQSGRLLDEYAVPFLARNEYGRGLYAVARAAAETIASASGKILGVTDPSVWPGQPQPEPLAGSSSAKARGGASGQKSERRRSYLPSLILSGVVLGLAGLWMFFALRRFGKTLSKAGRLRAASAGVGYLVLMWIAAPTALIILLASGGFSLGALLFALSPVAATMLWSKTRQRMKANASSYRLPCASCGSPMELIPENMDDAQLSVEEVAEETVGGMDYEVWNCPQCGAEERFATKLFKARNCPKCKRRTLVRTSAVLSAATASRGGRERVADTCKNPKCDYVKIWERNTPPVGTSSSGSSSSFGRSGFSSSSSSSRSSFGGGRSGGGGASRRF